MKSGIQFGGFGFIAGLTFGLSIGSILSKYISKQQLLENINFEEHNMNHHTGHKNIKAFIVSNPTCHNCNLVDDIEKKLLKNNITYESIFFPFTNTDIWLSSLLNNHPNKKNIYNWLKEHKELWENIEDIEDILALLEKQKIANISKSTLINESYNNSFLYSKAIGNIFDIQAIPTVVICLTLTGNIEWKELQQTINQMQQTYNKLKTNNKVL